MQNLANQKSPPSLLLLHVVSILELSSNNPSHIPANKPYQNSSNRKAFSSTYSICLQRRVFSNLLIPRVHSIIYRLSKRFQLQQHGVIHKLSTKFLLVKPGFNFSFTQLLNPLLSQAITVWAYDFEQIERSSLASPFSCSFIRVTVSPPFIDTARTLNEAAFSEAKIWLALQRSECLSWLL